MTTRDFKDLIRERMAKTGESYSIARMHLLRAKSSDATVAPIGSTIPVAPLWEDSWEMDGEDITSEILDTLYDDLVEVVHSGDYSVGYTEFEELIFRNIDREQGIADFHVQFSAEHPSAGFDFPGHVEGTLSFDPDAEDQEEFLDSLEILNAQEHFDIGDDTE